MQPLPNTASVVIIGGGFAGASTACALAQAGLEDVLVLEKESVCGYHASGRNAALCRQLVDDVAYTKLTIDGAKFLRSPPHGFSDVPLLRPTGSILLVDSDAQKCEVKETAQKHRILHHSVSMRDVLKAWPRLQGVPGVGGIAFPQDGVIDIHALLRGYLEVAQKAKHQIQVNCQVKEFQPWNGNCVRVHTTQGTVETRCVVVAAGAWAGVIGKIAASTTTDFTPIQRHLFITESIPTPERALPFVWHIGISEFYVRPEGTAFLLSGCDETKMEADDASVCAETVQHIAAKMAATAPHLAELGIARSWACLRTFAPLGRPVIDWDRSLPWLFWVAGLGGHGATASPAIGTQAAQKITAQL